MNNRAILRTWQLLLTIGLGLGSGLLLWPGIFSGPGDVDAQGNVNWPQISTNFHAGGLDNPVHITHAGDASGRLFVVEQDGRIRIIKNGTLLSTPFLNITDRVGTDAPERGLLSVAFPPDYATQGFFYVNYTDKAGDTVVARYQVTADPDIANPNSEEPVLTIDQPYANHNGGQLAFGPHDGYLYIGMGDGGSGGDPQNYAQNPNSLLGKLLRIDVATTTYAIPPDNPFVNDPGTRAEIWALGLRNPWRFSFDRQTGDLYIGDVGQGSREEIDFQPASSAGGENYGWRCKEGTQDFNMSGNCPNLTLEPPIHDYARSNGNCAVTGGIVYRGLNYCTMQRIYLYADYCSGRIWGLQHDGNTWQNQLLLDTSFNISTFGEDEAGNLYIADHAGGDIYLITAGTPATFPDYVDPTGVDAGDVLTAATHWHQQPGDTQPAWDARFDVNQDGTTNVVDVAAVAAALSRSCQ
jgi:glucose/arabinose dehydrogenase